MVRAVLILIVALQSIVYGANAGNVRDKLNDDSAIVFPGPINKGSSALPTRYGSSDQDDELEDCSNKVYCTVKPKTYPQDRFNNMFKDVKKVLPGASPSDLGERQGDPDEVDNCETDVSFKPLYQVRASPDQPWRNVIQAPEKNYVQSVRLETCRDVNKACFTVFPKLPTYTTFCKQKTTTWSFLVESEEGSGKTEMMTVDLPTCCSCHYKPI